LRQIVIVQVSAEGLFRMEHESDSSVSPLLGPKGQPYVSPGQRPGKKRKQKTSPNGAALSEVRAVDSRRLDRRNRRASLAKLGPRLQRSDHFSIVSPGRCPGL